MDKKLSIKYCSGPCLDYDKKKNQLLKMFKFYSILLSGVSILETT